VRGPYADSICTLMLFVGVCIGQAPPSQLAPLTPQPTPGPPAAAAETETTDGDDGANPPTRTHTHTHTHTTRRRSMHVDARHQHAREGMTGVRGSAKKKAAATSKRKAAPVRAADSDLRLKSFD
jgi:hypothetical protein